MVLVVLSLIPFLAVILRRFVFTGMGREWLLGEIDPPRPRQNGPLEQVLYILDPFGLTLVAGELENRADGQTPSNENIARKGICVASLPSPAPRK